MYLEDKANVIIDYISDDRYKQAVLINGAWGTGKTFFVEKVLFEKLESIGYTVMRYSLYGANSCEQIRKDIETEMLIKICSQKTKIPSKILDFVPNGIGIIAKKLGLESEDFASVIEKIDFDISKMVIIFDDLERTTAEINDVLGLINSYVENKELKVIIVANENEIGSSRISSDLPSKFAVAANSNILLPSKEKDVNEGQKESKDKNTYIKYDELLNRTKTIFSSDIIYNAIKEKLVGLSITLNVDFNQLYDVIISKYAIKSAKDFLIENKAQVVDILLIQGCQNLRTLIFGVITFDKIHSELNTLKGDNEEYNRFLEDELLKILRYVIYESIQYRSGGDANKINESNTSLRFLSCHMAGVKEYEFVNQFIFYHEFNAKEVRSFIDNYIKDIIQKNKGDEERNKLSYYKLCSWGWINLNDNDVIYYSDQLYTELNFEKYNTRYFKNIIVFLLQLDAHFNEKKNLLAHDNADYIELMEKYVLNHEQDQNFLDELLIFSDDKDFTQMYNKCVAPLITAYKSKKDNFQQEALLEVFSKDDWDKEFHQYCRDKHDYFLDSHRFLSALSIEKILEKLKSANNSQIREFTLSVCSVYDFTNIRDYYQSDTISLKQIVDLFQEMLEDKNCDCTKKLILKIYKEKLDEKLDALK